MNIQTTIKEQNKLILENLRLVHFIVQKYNIDSNEYEDYISIGTIGLVKAARTFNQSKGIKFSTYAMKCIKNEIFLQFKKVEKQYSNNISLDMVLYVEENGNEYTLGEIIESPYSDFITNIIETEESLNIINIILNVLDDRAKYIMLYKIAGIKQCDISKSLNISQSHVSRIERRAISKIKEYFNTLKKYRKPLRVKKVGSWYEISFSTKNINDFNSKFEVFLKRVENIQSSVNFKINYNNEIVQIRIIAELESFCFIADLIRELGAFK